MISRFGAAVISPIQQVKGCFVLRTKLTKILHVSFFGVTPGASIEGYAGLR